MTEFADEDERPLLSVLLDSRTAGGTRCVGFEIAHLLLVFLSFVSPLVRFGLRHTVEAEFESIRVS
jgi:hypothetical protein